MIRPGSGRRPAPASQGIKSTQTSQASRASQASQSQASICQKLRTISQKTQYRLRQMAKLTMDGIPDSEIALIFGYSNVCSVSNLRATPEYKVIYSGLVNAQTTELELEASKSAGELKKAIQCRIPEALRVYYDALQDKKIDNRLKAADKLIELDGRLGRKQGGESINQFFVSDGDLSIGDRIVESLAGLSKESKESKE